MSDTRKAVVLLSGGMDSCVSTAIARERHGARNIALLHAGYGQRTQRRERRAFEGIAGFYGARERLGGELDHFRAVGGGGRGGGKNFLAGKRGGRARPPGRPGSGKLIALSHHA